MRTVLYGIHLFNDNIFRHGHHIYIKWKEGKESKIAERQRGTVCARQSVAERGGNVGCKMGSKRNIMGDIRIGLRG
jgi:hypothetical protein